MNLKIHSFTDLLAWQKAHQLVLGIYRATKDFPDSEVYGLSSQVQRSAVSVTSNIAEGFSRKSDNDQRHYFYMSLGSLTEVQNQLLIAKDLSYINSETFHNLADQTVATHKLINGLIKSTSTRKVK